MKSFNIVLSIAVLICVLAFTGFADDQKTDKPKPYPLKTCLVCGMTLGDMGKPLTFVYKGQEIKVCNESEKKEFDKDPAKYLKKLADEAAKLKK